MFLFLIGLTLAVFKTTGDAAESKPREMLKLRLGLGSTPAPPLPNSVLWLAKDLGFYAREGLDVELIELRGTPTVITAMRTGDMDVGNISTSDVVKLTASHTLPMKAIHSPDARLYFLIAARDQLKSVADLKGKTFAIARSGSVDHSLSMSVIKTLGVNPQDLKLVAIGSPSTRAQALVGGRVDATSVSLGTWVSIQKEKGVKVLLDAERYFNAAPIVSKVNAVTPKVLESKAEHLRRLTAAVVKASRHFAEHQQAWVDAMAKRRADVAREDLNNLWKSFRTAWAVNGSMNLDLYAKSADFLYQTEDFKDVPKITVNDWASTRILDSVLKEVSVYDKFDEPGRAVR
ncbi:MAG TPA: ABC transporter substrate-binding protein [Terriglobales bacterium]|nr:ABC transporter substrate-binding protein [Terriglobales bacterium]